MYNDRYQRPPEDSLGRPSFLYSWCICPAMCLIVGLSEEPPEDGDLKEKRGAKLRVSWGGRTALWTVLWPCLPLCPGYFKCVVVYARHECRHLTGTRAEAELLVELWSCRMTLLRGTPDSLDGLRVLYRRIGCLPKKAVCTPAPPCEASALCFH